MRIIIIALSFLNLALAQQEVSVSKVACSRYKTIVKNITIPSGSTEFIANRHDVLADKIMLEIRRKHLSGKVAKSGKVDIYADGEYIDSIEYYSNTKIKWRKFIVNIKRRFRSLEIINNVGVKIKIRHIWGLRGGAFNGSRIGGLSSDDAAGLAWNLSQLSALLKEFVSGSDYDQFLAPIKSAAAQSINYVEIHGPYSEQTKLQLRKLVALITASEPLLLKLRDSEASFEAVNEIDFARKALGRLIE